MLLLKRRHFNSTGSTLTHTWAVGCFWKWLSARTFLLSHPWAAVHHRFVFFCGFCNCRQSLSASAGSQKWVMDHKLQRPSETRIRATLDLKLTLLNWTCSRLMARISPASGTKMKMNKKNEATGLENDSWNIPVFAKRITLVASQPSPGPDLKDQCGESPHHLP